MGDVAEQHAAASIESLGPLTALSEKAADPGLPLYMALRLQCRLLERGDEYEEPSYVRRVLRALPRHRPVLTSRILIRLINATVSSKIPSHATLRANLNSTFTEKALPSVSTSDSINSPSSRSSSAGSAGSTTATSPSASSNSRSSSASSNGSSRSSSTTTRRRRSKVNTVFVSEMETYLYLLVTLYHLDSKDLESAGKVAKMGIDALAKMPAKATLDPMAARMYQVYLLIAERSLNLETLRPWVLNRANLVSTRHMVESTAVLMNGLLRLFCLLQLYTQAAAFLERVDFPSGVDENQLARYCYYRGCVKAIQLNYTEAARLLLDALTRTHVNAIGFRQRVMKLKVVVDMLAAKEFPEKALFQQPIFRRCLRPYRKITGAVRQGDVHYFNQILSTYHNQFESDGTLMFVNLLRRDVLKTAIRLVSKAYRRISLQQLRAKLEIEALDDVEYILIRAIKDNWVTAQVDHDTGTVTFSGFGDVYNTTGPTREFHKRLRGLLDLHHRVSLLAPLPFLLPPTTSPTHGLGSRRRRPCGSPRRRGWRR